MCVFFAVYLNIFMNFRNSIHCIFNLPADLCNSGATRSLRSGSSPYQKIHSSLAAVNDSGGCVTAPLPPDTDIFRSNRFAEASGSCLGAATRRHTHRISAARHRAYELRTGSSSGSPVASGRSPRPSLRHLMPQRSVYWKWKWKSWSYLFIIESSYSF